MAIAYLKPRKARPFFGRHPWVFENAVSRVTGAPAAGDAVELRTDKDDFVAHGLYNPHSKIRVRLYSWERDRPVDDELFASRIERAMRFRTEALGFDGPRHACRLVYSESDGLSGLVVDRYADALVLQVTSLAVSKRLDGIVAALQRLLSPRCILLRTEKGIAELEGLEQTDRTIAGEAPEEPLIVEENGLEFFVELQTGQKTGLYLDQRDNRMAFARYVRGRQTLDLFCNSGAFSLCSLKHGQAASALGIDVSSPAIEQAKRNAAHNGLAAEFVQEEAVPALKRLHREGLRFGAIVCDPPKFARSAGAIDRALRGYEQINTLALNVLEPGGILATCSCSGLVSMEQFLAVLTDVSQRSGRELHILEMRGQAPDHPVSTYCRETEYLKCVIVLAVT